MTTSQIESLVKKQKAIWQEQNLPAAVIAKLDSAVSHCYRISAKNGYRSAAVKTHIQSAIAEQENALAQIRYAEMMHFAQNMLRNLAFGKNPLFVVLNAEVLALHKDLADQREKLYEYLQDLSKNLKSNQNIASGSTSSSASSQPVTVPFYSVVCSAEGLTTTLFSSVASLSSAVMTMEDDYFASKRVATSSLR
jgi:hypothetical protein